MTCSVSLAAPLPQRQARADVRALAAGIGAGAVDALQPGGRSPPEREPHPTPCRGPPCEVYFVIFAAARGSESMGWLDGRSIDDTQTHRCPVHLTRP